MVLKGRMRRGTGLKWTLPFVWRYSVLWIIATVGAVPIFAFTSLQVWSDILSEEARGIVLHLVLTRTPLIVLAVGALAVFTTHRLAGPYIALKRAFDDVKNGDFDRRLHLRESDAYLNDLQASFNEMMDAVQLKIRDGHT